jgi:phosphoglycerate-specific signal transduction histidine kinase
VTSREGNHNGNERKSSGAEDEVRIVYSPKPMEDREKQQHDLGALEEKVDELEKLTDSLDEVPEEELVGTLGEAVELLAEINAGIEARLDTAGEKSHEVGSLLGQVDFGPFDEAMEDHEQREKTTGEPGA